jgi:hypothetical protein
MSRGTGSLAYYIPHGRYPLAQAQAHSGPYNATEHNASLHLKSRTTPVSPAQIIWHLGEFERATEHYPTLRL